MQCMPGGYTGMYRPPTFNPASLYGAPPMIMMQHPFVAAQQPHLAEHHRTSPSVPLSTNAGVCHGQEYNNADGPQTGMVRLAFRNMICLLMILR